MRRIDLNIKVRTSLRNDYPNFEQKTQYDDELHKVLKVLVPTYPEQVDNIDFIEGEGCVVYNEERPTILEIINGELCIIGEDADKYSLNTNGELLFTTS